MALLREEIQALLETEFETLCEELKNDSESLMFAIKARCEFDFKLFSLFFFSHYCEKDFSKFHKDLCRVYATPARDTRRANAAPRGSAKSTFCTLIKPIHDICYGNEKFIVIFSNTESQAVSKLKDIRAELLENELLIGFFGKFFNSKKVAETQFTVNCEGNKAMVMALGSGTEVRGLRFGSARPTKIICDDVEHSEEVFSEEVRQKYDDWYKQVVSKLGDENTNIEFVGTILHKKSLLSELLKNPRYSGNKYKSVISWATNQTLWNEWKRIFRNLEDDKRLETARRFYEQNEEAMLEGSDVLWPARVDYYSLMVTREEIGPRAFAKEEQNDPISDDTAVFTDLHYFTETSEGLRIETSGTVIPWAHLRAYGVIDPATGQTKAKAGKKGDFACVLVGYTDPKGRLFIVNDWTKRAVPTAQIEAILDNEEKHRFEKFGVETNLFRNLLLENIQTAKEAREKRRREQGVKNYGLKVSFQEIIQVENKQKRIFSLEPKTTTGWILFSRSLSNEFMNQVESFPLGEHDDAPDALEMLWSLLNNRYQSAGAMVDPMRGR